jgi:dTMP kinase
MRGRVFALLQSLIRVVLILALAVVPFAVAQVGRRTFHIGHVDYVVDGTRFVLVGGGLLALAAGLLAYRKMDEGERIGIWADFKASLRGDTSTRRRMHSGGVFVAFEGGEGTGKSTQVELLAVALRDAGRTVVTTREPGATEVGRQIRDLVLHHREPLTPRAEALLFAADRALHVDTVIRPALDRGEVVLTDRFVDSSLAYQGVGRELSVDEVRRVSRWATGDLRPDLTVLLDLPAAIGLARAHGRGEADKLERESVEFHERVREAFRIQAESNRHRYLLVDASLPPERIAEQVRSAVEALLAPRRPRLRVGASSAAQHGHA